jgi:hypothetical protein
MNQEEKNKVAEWVEKNKPQLIKRILKPKPKKAKKK